MILSIRLQTDLFVAAPESSTETPREPVAAEAAEDMFADGADPMEMALLDDIFGAYARDMGVEMGARASEKRKGEEKEKRKSSKAAKKVF